MAKMNRYFKPKISVAIPTHEMEGGEQFLRESLVMLNKQTFVDFDVVISDNSDNNNLQEVVSEFPHLVINYFKNPVKGMAQNSNTAIKACTGKIIKILYLDDFLFSERSLEEIDQAFDIGDQWMVTGCIHTFDGFEFDRPHFPSYNPAVHLGNNTIGSPSVMAIRNEHPLLFDEKLTWLLDGDLYRRYYEKRGPPKILNSLNVAIRQGKHQMTNIISKERKEQEYEYTNTKNYA